MQRGRRRWKRRCKNGRVTPFHGHAWLLTPHQHQCSTCIRHIDTCVRIGRGEDAGANAQRIQILVHLCSTKAAKRPRAVLLRECTNTGGRKSRHRGEYHTERGVRRRRTARHNPEKRFLAEKPRSRGRRRSVARRVFRRLPGRVFRRPDTTGPRTQYFCSARTSLSLSRNAPVCASACTDAREGRSCVGFGTGLYWRVGTGSFLLSFVCNPHSRHRRLTHHGRYAAGDVHRREKNRWSWQERGYAREPFFFLTRALFEGFKGHGD